jgi:predicted transcriptional regulator
VTTTAPPPPFAMLAGPAPAPGLPPRQGIVLTVLWEARRPLTAAQISTRLPTPGTGHALSQLRAAGLVTATRKGHTHRYQAVLSRDDYLAGLVAAALDQAGDPAAVLRTALNTPPSRAHE